MHGPRCPECDADLGTSDPSKDFDHDKEDGIPILTSDSGSTPALGISQTPKKGKGKNRKREHGDDELFFQPSSVRSLTCLGEYDREYKRNPLAKMADGAKVLAVIKHILKWQKEAPDDKIIG